MNAGRLVARNLLAHPVRSGLVVAFACLTLFLFGFLRSILTSLDEAVASSPAHRVLVGSGVGPLAEIPAGYRDKIREVPEVASVARLSWFGGWFRDREDWLAAVAVDLEEMLGQYPEIDVAPEEREALLGDPGGCMLGRALARRLGLGPGDALPLMGTLYPLPDGRAWDLTVRAVYDSTDPWWPETVCMFHWERFEETRRAVPTLAVSAGTVTMFVVTARLGTDSAALCDRIDERWARGPVRTRTQTEAAHRAGEVAMIGEIPSYLAWIGGISIVAMLLAAGNAMGIVASERARDAGVLKALGFSDARVGRLLVAESTGLVGLGGVLGLVAAKASAPAVRHVTQGGLAGYEVLPETLVLGALLSLAVGALAGLPAALRLARLRPVDVLRSEG